MLYHRSATATRSWRDRQASKETYYSGKRDLLYLQQRDHGEIDRLPQLVAVQSVGLREMQEKWKDEGEKIRDNDSKFQVVYDVGCLPTSPLPPQAQAQTVSLGWGAARSRCPMFLTVLHATPTPAP